LAQHFTWSPFLQQGFHEIERFGSLTFAARPETNLIHNGDFTSPAKGTAFGGWWVHEGDRGEGAWAIVSNCYVKGGQALRLSGCRTNAIAVKQALPDLKPDTEYLLTFYIRAEDLKPSRAAGGAKISIWDQENRYFPANPYTGTMPWAKQGFAFRTSAGVNARQKSYVSLILRDADGTVWFDDVRLREAEGR
jgi:hypothetical protein